MKTILIALLLLAPTVSLASEVPSSRWELFSVGMDGSKYYIDKKTKTKGSAWVWTIHEEPKRVSTYAPYEDSNKARWRFTCVNKTMGISEHVAYYADGTSKSNKFNNVQMNEAIPDTIGESMIEYLCKK